MRDIKFRVWNKLQNKMYKSFDMYEMVVGHPEYDEEEITDSSGFPVGTVFLQFTDLKDKNKKEICEGDIIKILSPFDDDKYSTFEITFEEGAFLYRFVKSTEEHNNTGKTDSGYLREEKLFLDCEVIGNIYENLELLKKDDAKGDGGD